MKYFSYNVIGKCLPTFKNKTKEKIQIPKVLHVRIWKCYDNHTTFGLLLILFFVVKVGKIS